MKTWRWAAIFAPTEPASSGTWTRLFERFPILRERRDQAAGTLSGGEQQMLAIGRALMSRPKLVLFDEPSLGLAPNLVAQTFDIIRQIRAEGVTVVMVEQNAFAALELCDRAYVLEQGRVAMTGTGAELLDNPHVKAAYLGIGDVPSRTSAFVEQRKSLMNAAPVYDLILQGGHVICPASGIDGVMDVAIAGGKIAAVAQGHPAVDGAAGDRRARQAGAAGHDRHPRPRLSLRHRPLRPRRRHGAASRAA